MAKRKTREELEQSEHDLRCLAEELGYLQVCDDLETIVTFRGVEAMPLELASAVARRVMLHLYRGSIESARTTLNEGWKTHVDDDTLVQGPDILREPLSRMIPKDEIRLLNLLEEGGIMTVADLLRSAPADWLAIPSVGQSAVAKLTVLQISLKARAGKP